MILPARAFAPCLLVGLLVSAPAHAAPTFTGAPEDVALATAIWESATACTGREGKAHRTDELRRDYAQTTGFAALAQWDARGLYAILLSPTSPSVVLAHEVGHAWFNGPDNVGLIEGRTELVATCVAERSPEVIPYLYDPFPSLAEMPDITSWGAGSETALSPDQLGVAWVASWRSDASPPPGRQSPNCSTLEPALSAVALHGIPS